MCSSHTQLSLCAPCLFNDWFLLKKNLSYVVLVFNLCDVVYLSPKIVMKNLPHGASQTARTHLYL